MFLTSLIALLLLAILATVLVIRSYHHCHQWGVVLLALFLLLAGSTYKLHERYEAALAQSYETGKHAGGNEASKSVDALKRQLQEYRARLAAISQALSDD